MGNDTAKMDTNKLEPVPTLQHGQIETKDEVEHDAVFGELNEDAPNYRNVCETMDTMFPRC